MLAAGALALTLAGVRLVAPRQAEVEAPREVVAPAAATRGARRGRASDTCGAASAVANAAAPRERSRCRGDASREPVPEAAAAAYQRALAAMRAESWLEAELELEQLTLEHPSYPGPHVNLALVYLHDARRDDAREALERALALEPGHAAANTQLGILLREEGKFAEAEQRIAARSPPIPSTRLRTTTWACCSTSICGARRKRSSTTSCIRPR